MNRISLVLLLTVGHAGCGGGGGGDEEPAPSLAISSPADASLVRSTVTIVVGVQDAEAGSVRLVVDGTLVQEKLVGPFEFDWDSTTVADGVHTITVIAAAGEEELSAQLDLDVDNTAPTALGQSPVPGADNIWIGTSIELTASEALAASSSFSVQDGDGQEVASTAALDGDTVTIVLNEQPALPSDLTVIVAATDLAGNALDLAAAWTFNAPAALILSTPTDSETDTDASLGDVTVTSQGALVATWALEQELHVGSYDGTAWASGAVATGYAGRVAVDHNDRPYVSYSAPGPMGNTVARVIHFDGTSFDQVGMDIGNGRDVMGHDIAVDSTGTAYVTWIAISRIYVAKWAGKWQPVGAALTTLGSFIQSPRIEIDHNDNPVVSYEQTSGDATYVFVWRHEDDAWTSLGGKLDAVVGANTHARMPDLAIAANNDPVVTWAEADGGAQEVYVRRWDGATWQPVADAISQRPGMTTSRSPSIAINAQDRIALAWYEEIDDDNDSVPLWRFDGTSWASTFDTQRDSALQTYVVPRTVNSVLVDNASLVMWSEERSGNNTYALGLRRENRLP